MRYEEVKNSIIKTIDGSIQLEPTFQISIDYEKLITQKEKDIYFKAVEEVAIHGKLEYRKACLIAINMMNKAKESENVVKLCVEKFNFNTEMMLASPLMSLCAIISTDWSIDFIKKIIQDFKTVKNMYNLYYFSIRKMVLSSRWLEIIDEINIALSTYNNSTFVDYLAFFKSKRGKVDFERLKKNLSKENLDRVLSLSSEIEIRYKNYI